MAGATHVYSSSAVATPKRRVDLQITGGDPAKEDKIDMKSEEYLKKLIKLSSKGATEVSDRARGLQFFIIEGGAEGFLAPSYKNHDADNRVVGGGVTTSGTPGVTMRFSDTDLLAVFDAHGNLVSSALLRRPMWIAHADPIKWSEEAATNVYDAWDGASVSIYHNTNPRWDIHYYGLWMNDARGYYTSGRYQVDLHKQEATNGCIFIVDDSTPPYLSGNPAAIARLNSFEPQLIKDVQETIHAQVKQNIGIMHMVEIQ